MKRNKIIAIAPAFNEQGKIGNVAKNMPKDIVDEFLVINDGSTDNTQKEVEKNGARVLRHKKREGVGCALRDGIYYAIKNNFDIIVILAGNGKDNPQEIPRLIGPIVNEGYDYVQGSRYLKGGSAKGDFPIYRKIATKVYPFLIRLTTGFPATEGTNGFRAYKTSIFDDKRIDINQKWLDGTSFEFYLHLKVLKLGYKVKEVPVTKTYPKKSNLLKYKSYTKTRPIIDWWHVARPIIYLTLRIKK